MGIWIAHEKPGGEQRRWSVLDYLHKRKGKHRRLGQEVSNALWRDRNTVIRGHELVNVGADLQQPCRTSVYIMVGAWVCGWIIVSDDLAGAQLKLDRGQ